MVVVLSGLGSREAEWLMPALSHLSAEGVAADYLQPPDPALEAAARSSLFTGVSPGFSGIVADAFRKAGQPIGQNTSGLAPVQAAEPIWRTAMRHGLTSALVGFESPSVSDGQRSNWLVTPGTIVAPSAQHILKFGPAAGWQNAPPTYSPAREARASIAAGAALSPDLFVLALDSTDDRRENYDTWLLSRSKTIDAHTPALRLNEWSAVVVDHFLQARAWFKITDANSAHFAVYQSAVTASQVAPPNLAREITASLGAPPASADRAAHERYWIDAPTFVELAEREGEWLLSAALYLYGRHRPDLLILRLGTAGDAGRYLWLSDPRQATYSAERSQAQAAAMRRAYEFTGRALGRLYAQLDLNSSALLIVSDHGLAPVHTVLNLNRWLVERKWLSLQRNGDVDLPQSKAYAEAGGGSAHIYINLKDRDPGGAVEPSAYEALQVEIAGALRELVDPVDGQPVVTRVVRRQELAALGLQHENAGDLYAQARVGFALSARRDRPVIFEPSTMLAAGGYDARLPEMRGVFLAVGSGIRRGVRVAPPRALDLAPTIARLLRFPPAQSGEGRVIEGALK